MEDIAEFHLSHPSLALFQGFMKASNSSKAANLFLTSLVEISRSIKEPKSVLASVVFGLGLV